MADEDLTATEAEQGSEAASGEGAGAVQTTETTEAQPDPIAQLASEMGWKPKEEYQGDPDNWKPAADFIKAGRDITQTVTKQLRSVQDELQRVTRTSAQLMADKLAERDSYWAQQHAKAVEDGDQQLATRAVQERLKIQQSVPIDGPPPETADFLERNKSWYGVNGDPLATLRAEQITDMLAKRGLGPAEQLRQAERMIRKEFPELFPAPVKQPAAVQTAQSRNAATGSRVKGFADMPAESQKLARDFNERHGVPLEKFAESYWSDQANSRRVG